jgi:mono/diheme cytochrome c family protein
MTRRTTLVTTLLALAACGGDAPPAQPPSSSSGASAAAPAAELSAVELEQGIGPIRDLVLGAEDPALAETGEAAFTMKCSACHKIEERYIGPELGQVLARRSPEFVMNQILNSTEMVARHPVVRELLAEYYTPMPVQVTDPDEARAILEYLRSAQTGAPSTSNGSAGGL